MKNCVPTGCYDDVLVIAETSKSEPNAEQLKYYARGVGNVRVGWRGKGEKLQETLELTGIAKLSPEALAKARAAALDLDQRAYRFSKNVRRHAFCRADIHRGTSIIRGPVPRCQTVVRLGHRSTGQRSRRYAQPDGKRRSGRGTWFDVGQVLNVPWRA